MIYKQADSKLTKRCRDHHQVHTMVVESLAHDSNNNCCSQASAILQYIPLSSQDSSKGEW